MNRTLLNRLERLEAHKRQKEPPLERVLVVIQGVKGEDNRASIDALIRHGDAQPHDIFIVGISPSPTPRDQLYSRDFAPYRLFKGETTLIPLEHLQ